MSCCYSTSRPLCGLRPVPQTNLTISHFRLELKHENWFRGVRMKGILHWRRFIAGLATSALLASCGGGGSSSSPAPTGGGTLPPETGAPASVGNIALDGL